jgi:hypothetical protein
MQKITIKNNKNYFYLSKDNKIIYIQKARYGGYEITTVHKPNIGTGTGFKITDEPIGEATLLANLDFYFNIHAPAWATQTDLKETKKYETLEQFLNYEKKFFKDDVQVIDIDNVNTIFN